MDEIFSAFKNIGKEALKIIASEKNGRRIVGTNPLGQKSIAMDHLLEDLAIGILKEKHIGNILVTEEKGEVPLNPDFKGIVVLDPLDGSGNYEKGIPVYCMGIAYSNSRFSDDITHSYVIDLARGDEFFAQKGKGAFMNGKKISVSNTAELSKCSLAIDYNHSMNSIGDILPLLEKINDVRRLGANILDMCYLANGGYDCFIDIRNTLSVIHICGVKIAEEAGAIVNDRYGSKINAELKIDQYISVVGCANEKIHNQVMPFLSGSRRV